jgi:hypothetical protein
MTCSLLSSVPSSASSADALAPVSAAISAQGAHAKNIAGKRTERLSSDSDHPAVGLVGDAIDVDEIVRVRDHFITGEDILDMESARRRDSRHAQ